MTLVKYSIQISHNGKTLIDQSGEKEIPAEEALELSSSFLDVVGGVASHAPTKPLRKNWTEKELWSIMSAESAADAVEMFFEANPHSTRTRRAVEKAFNRHVAPTLEKPVEEIKETPDLPAQPLVDECEKEQDLEREKLLDDCEVCDGTCLGCDKDSADEFEEEQEESLPSQVNHCEECGAEVSDDRADVSLIFTGKVLCTKCHDDKMGTKSAPPEEEIPVTQHAPVDDEEEPQKETGRGRSWTDPEKEILLWSGSANEALENYRKNYPDSSRGDKSISSMWYHFKNTGKLKFSFKIDQNVRITDPDLPHYGEVGRAVELRQNTVLVRIGPSTIWVSRDSLEVESSARN